MGGDFEQPAETPEIHISDDNLEEALEEIDRILDVTWNPDEPGEGK